MSTYTTPTDVVNNIEGFVIDDSYALERLIQRCEQDLDRFLVPIHRDLPPTQVISLAGATGGSFTLTWNGTHPQTTPVENWLPSASQLNDDLAAFTDIGAGNVTVLGSDPYTIVWSEDWARKYIDSFNSIPLLSVNSSLTPSNNVRPTVVYVRGRKINRFTDLTANESIALSNATCAQIEYRLANGEAFFVRAQYQAVKGPDFATQGKMPYIAPKAKRELAQSGLLLTQTRAVSSYHRRDVGSGAPNF